MKKKFIKVTNWLFITTQVSALLWVTFSYLIAAYATVYLKQPFPIEELSKTAIETILGVTALKVLGNIFEHNNSKVFGTSTSIERVNDDEDQLG